MIDFGHIAKPRRYQIELGHACVQVESISRDEAIREARRRLCVDMPRLWDVIHGMDESRFRVAEVPPF